MKKKVLLLLCLAIAAVAVYYTVAILNARAKTKAIVETALASDRMKLELEDLTPQQIDALIKVHDPNFYNHNGIDFFTPGAGVTTISQGLVKMYYFDSFQPGLQKIDQSLIARFAFDPLTPKATILKLFINEVYLGEAEGNSLKGLENASQYYFNKSFKEINWDEYLSLIAMIRAPFNFHYVKKRAENLVRVDRIKSMLAGDYIPVDNSDLFYDRKQ